MNKTANWLKRIFTPEVITFVAGIITTVILQAVFENVIPILDGLLYVSVILLIIFSIISIVRVRQTVVDTLAHSRLLTKVYYAKKTAQGDASLYNPVIERISNAEESIKVIGLFRPPSLEYSSGRAKYYEAIEELLQRKHNSGQRFRYERIVQVKKVDAGQLKSDQVDQITFKHCQFLIESQQEKSSLIVNLQQIPDILGSISFLLIDDKEIVFAIPTTTRIGANKLRAVQLGTGLIFTDPEGTMAKEFVNLFDDLQLDADRVINAIDSDEEGVSKVV